MCVNPLSQSIWRTTQRHLTNESRNPNCPQLETKSVQKKKKINKKNTDKPKTNTKQKKEVKSGQR